MTALVVPSTRDLVTISPADRWNLEDALDEAQGVLHEFNDDELRRWVEVDGKTQREIAEMVGRSHQRINQRCQKLGLEPRDPRGGDRLPTPRQNGEVIDAEVVDESPPRRRTGATPEGPTHHFPDVVAEDAEDNLRTQALHWFEQGLHVKELLDRKQPLEPRSDEDRTAIKRQAAVMERVAQRVKERAYV